MREKEKTWYRICKMLCEYKNYFQMYIISMDIDNVSSVVDQITQFSISSLLQIFH